MRLTVLVLLSKGARTTYSGDVQEEKYGDDEWDFGLLEFLD